MRRLLLVVAVAALLTACDDGSETVDTSATVGASATAPSDPRASSTQAPTTTVDPLERPDVGVVVEVIDGDTAVIEVQGTDEHVRFIGIDTPEPVGGIRDPECFGLEASDATKAMLPPGTLVRLERDVEPRDRYDRLLAYVFRYDDELFVNLHLAEQGFADTLNIEPNSTYASLFRTAVADARELGLGLWSTCGSADVLLDD